MNTLIVGLAFMGILIGSPLVFAQEAPSDQNVVVDQQAGTVDNEVIKDEGYGNDEEYYGAENVEENAEDEMPANTEGNAVEPTHE